MRRGHDAKMRRGHVSLTVNQQTIITAFTRTNCVSHFNSVF